MDNFPFGKEVEQFTIQELVTKCSEIAEAKGWGETRTFGDLISLMHSELSEALEEFRNGHSYNEIYYNGTDKPEGIPIELADCIIRIMHFFGKYNINLQDAIVLKMKYNETREMKHGGKII